MTSRTRPIQNYFPAKPWESLYSGLCKKNSFSCCLRLRLRLPSPSPLDGLGVSRKSSEENDRMITMSTNVICQQYSVSSTVFSELKHQQKLFETSTAAGLPALDFDKRMKFPLPFLIEKPITFYGHPSSPAEGYIAHNFACETNSCRQTLN